MMPELQDTDLPLIAEALSVAIYSHTERANRARMSSVYAACGNADFELEEVPAFNAAARQHVAQADAMRDLLARLTLKGTA